MEPVDPRIDPRTLPPGCTAIVVAEHQDEYRNLPSVILPPSVETHCNKVVTRWRLTEAERADVVRGADVFITIYGTPMRPILPTIGPTDWKAL